MIDNSPNSLPLFDIIIIMVRTGFFTTYMIYFQPQWLSHPLISAVGPVVVAVVLAYIINSIFMNVFVITIDTILLCYCMDRKHGTDHGVSPEDVAEWSNGRRTGKFTVEEQEMAEINDVSSQSPRVQDIPDVPDLQDIPALSPPPIPQSTKLSPVSQDGVMDLADMPMA